MTQYHGSGIFIIAFLAALLSETIDGYGSDNKKNQSAEKVSIGTKITELCFKDIRALNRSLTELGDHDAWVIVFTTTQCPLVRQTLPRLVELERELHDRDIQFLAVNVGAGDTIRQMAAQAIDLNIPFPFVKDTDFSVTRTLGVKRTPEIVVLSRDLELRYRGRLDDQFRIGGAKPVPTRRDLFEALNEVLKGQQVSVAETLVDGCLISIPSEDSRTESPVEYYGQADKILLRNCTQCHQPESNAPFSLLTLEDAVSNAQMIAEVVRDETMPPWYASKNHGKFQNDPSLSSDEKRTLISWIQGGCRAGDPKAATPAPILSEAKWRIGEPDLIITMLETHSVPATGFVPYRYTVLPYLFTNETWVEAFEIRPDNRAVVHHCNMAYITSDGAGEETFITGYVPGGQPMDLGRFKNGVAYKIPGGAGLGLQIHYTTTGKEEQCRIQVGLRFPRNAVRKQCRHFLLDPRGWKIPPYEPAFRIEASHKLSDDVTLLGLFTHMHVRGRDMTFSAASPDGQKQTLLQIPNYNFEWQLGYEIEPGQKRLSAGTTIEAVAHFDNSSFNPYNPDPAAEVRYGPQTIHEMFNGFVFFVNDAEELALDVDPRTGRSRK
ncbi:MAG: redoxin family protein [Planctomycetaceae bacterium]